MKTAVVLSGGGAKGAYQIGVWKALRKLHINYDIVTGTSVGALNGVLMVQNDYHKAYNLWSNIDYSFIFNTDFKNVKGNIYTNYIKGFVKDGGMDVTNLENALNKVFDEGKFYSSCVDYGIIVYNLSKLKEELLTKAVLKSDTIRDYIIASATCYPAFKIKKINNSKYIDGGYYDYLPINLAIDLGAEKIIAVDLKAPGIRKKTKDITKEIINIYPHNNIGSFLEFDKYIARKNIKYGYNDTMKEFKRLIGNKYTFRKNTYNYISQIILKKFNRNMDDYLKVEGNILEQLKSIIPKLLINNIKNPEDKLLCIIEYAGEIFKLDDSKIYFLNNYNHCIKTKFKNIPKINEKLIKDKIAKNDIDSLLGSKYIVIYIYQLLKNNEKNKELYSLMPIFKKEFLVAVYLISIGC